MASYSYRYLKPARAEYFRHIAWLNERTLTGRISGRFVEEIEAAVERALSDPICFREIGYRDYRLIGPTETFKFSVIFTIQDGTVVIVAVAHPSRRPRYWASRKI